MCENEYKIENDTEFQDLLRCINECNEAEKPKQTKQTIVIDWLTLSMTKQMPDVKEIKRKTIENGKYQINDKCSIEYINSQINGFNDSAYLYIDDTFVGTILFNSKNDLPKHTIHLIIENSLFYSNTFTGYIKYLVYTLDFRINHIVRLDIALDFIQMYIFLFLHKFDKSSNILKRGNATYKTTKKAKSIIGFKIGSEFSDKQISVYPKTKELLSNPKPYIQDLWTANGMNHIDNDVERVELRLKTKELKNVDIWQLCNVEYLIAICRLHFKDYFQFESTYIQNYKPVIKDVTPFDITFNGLSTLYLNKIKATPKETDITLKTKCKSKVFDILFEQLAQDNEKDLTLINPENLDFALYSLERFMTLNPEMKAYHDRKLKTWENEFRIKYVIYIDDKATLKPKENADRQYKELINNLIIENYKEISNTNNKSKTMFNDRLDDKIMKNMCKESLEPAMNNNREAIIIPAYKSDSIESNLTANNVTFINELYAEYIPMSPKNSKVSHDQFMKVLIFALAANKENRTWTYINDILSMQINDNFPFVCNDIINYIMTNNLNINLTIAKIQ